MRTSIAAILTSLALLAACGPAAEQDNNTSNNTSNNASSNNTSNNASNNASGAKKATGEGPCAEADECQGDVCVSLIDGANPPVYCTETCDGGCPSGFYCDKDTFSLVGLDFCRFGATEPNEPKTPEEPPRLPCTSDEDCDSGTVCATFEGERSCTLACDSEEACTTPSVGGVVVDLLTCGADATPGVTRNVCLPDPACFPNATSCIDFGIPGF